MVERENQYLEAQDRVKRGESIEELDILEVVEDLADRTEERQINQQIKKAIETYCGKKAIVTLKEQAEEKAKKEAESVKLIEIKKPKKD